MRAVLVTKFPKTFVERNVRPRLLERGVEVVDVVDPDRTEKMPAGQYEAALFMNELAGHSMWIQTRDAAKRAGKKLWVLSRKSASWPPDLRDDRAVADRKLSAEILRESSEVPVQASDEGDAELLRLYDQDNEQLRAELRKVRADLSHQAEEIDAQRRCYNELNAKYAALEAAREKLAEDGHAAAEVVVALQRKVEDLSAELSSARAPKANGLGALLSQVRPLVPALLTAEEALERLAKYAADKKG